MIELDYALWTAARSLIRAVLFLWFVWPPDENRRKFSYIAAAMALIFASEAVRILPILTDGGLVKAFTRQILLVAGAYCATRLLLRAQRLYSFYIGAVFSFALGMWKNLITPYVFSGISFPASFVESSIAFSQPVRTALELVVYLATLAVLKRIFFNVDRDSRVKGNQVFVVLFPVLSNWVIMVLLYNSFFFEHQLLDYENGRALMVVFALLVAASLSIIVIAERYFKTERRREDLAKEQSLLEKSYEHMETLRRADEGMRMLEHDMKNHLMTLSRLSDEKGEAALYIKRLIDDIQTDSGGIHTGNSTLDVVMEQKRQLCAQNQIELQAYIDFKDGGFLEPMEICTLFANCMDNAVEAICRENKDAAERVVTVSCALVTGCLAAKFSNPSSAKPSYINGALATSKEDGENHGYGLRSVRRIVERHGGVLRINHEDGVFVTMWMIPVKPSV